MSCRFPVIAAHIYNNRIKVEGGGFKMTNLSHNTVIMCTQCVAQWSYSSFQYVGMSWFKLGDVLHASNQKRFTTSAFQFQFFA